MVPRGRLELPHPKIHAPKACASANSATAAQYLILAALLRPTGYGRAFFACTIESPIFLFRCLACQLCFPMNGLPFVALAKNGGHYKNRTCNLRIKSLNCPLYVNTQYYTILHLNRENTRARNNHLSGWLFLL